MLPCSGRREAVFCGAEEVSNVSTLVLKARASQGGVKLTRHASHRRRPSSPTRHSLSSFREHSRHFRHFGWYLLPRGPSTVSFSVARTEQPAQIKSPPRPAGGRGRREKRDGSTEELVGDEDGMLYFGGRVVGLGRSRVEREVGSAEGKSGAAAAARAGLGENVGRAHCTKSGKSAVKSVRELRQTAHLLVVRQAILLHEPFLADERLAAAGTAEASLMEAATAPRHGDAPSNAELLPAGEASRALSLERRFGDAGSGSRRYGIGVVDRLLQLRNDRSIRLRRRCTLQRAQTCQPWICRCSSRARDETYLSMPPPRFGFDEASSSEFLATSATSEARAMHSELGRGQLDKICVAERLSANGTDIGRCSGSEQSLGGGFDRRRRRPSSRRSRLDRRR